MNKDREEIMKIHSNKRTKTRREDLSKETMTETPIIEVIRITREIIHLTKITMLSTKIGQQAANNSISKTRILINILIK